MNPVLTDSPAYPFAELEAKKAALVAAGRPLYDFTIGDPMEPTPPFIRDAMIAAIPPVSQYPTVLGRRSFRESVARYLARRFGVTADPATEIIPCSGAKEAIFHLPFAIVGRASERRTVVWGEPAYPVYERGAAYAGADRHAVTLRAERGFLLEPDDVPDAVWRRTVLLFVNTPHNPTGATGDRAWLERIAACARKFGFVVCSDETYADVYFREPPPSLLEVMRENALVVHSLSKRSGMTGYRSGFIAGDPKLVAALRKMRPSVGVASPEFVQAAAEAAWNDDAHAAERRRIFGEKRAKVMALCAELGLEALDSGAGLYVWTRVPAGETGASYAARLLEEGVVVSPGESFGAAGAGFVRAALVPLASELDAALSAWRRAHRGA